ncbi:glucosamine-6-phosphate isomerase [Victivallis vadensis]|uniref:glucosamine-6-phosphate isomerase n=1 Tax=Victivallis vadensis TaxID=172901 RepID=UPI003AF78E05
MTCPLSKVAPDWWDYTCLDREILDEAAKITLDNLKDFERPGFLINIYDTLQEFYCAEALEYIAAWKLATADNPCGICGPVGPTEQLPLVAQMVNALELNLKHAHFWGMDEWVVDGKAVDEKFPLGFAKADLELCFDRIRPELRMPRENMHFPSENLAAYSESYRSARCLVMQGGQGETKHWAFNDPLPRREKYANMPPAPEDYRSLSTRIVDLHPITLIQNARTSGGGTVQNVPERAVTVGPQETWQAEQVSIWHPGHHDTPFGQRLTTFMISQKIADSRVPMSLLADHDHVVFNFYRNGFGSCGVEMH